MLKIKFKDLQLVMEHLTGIIYSESVTIDTNEAGGVAISIAFTDKNQKESKVFVYDASKNVTPEVRVTSKLYKKDKI